MWGEPALSQEWREIQDVPARDVAAPSVKGPYATPLADAFPSPQPPPYMEQRRPLMSQRLLAVSATSIAAAAAGAALACSCIGYSDAATQLAEARLMVVARAEWTKPERGAADPGQKVTRFRVVRTIKGETRRTWQIAHHVEGATCGVVFQPGKEYVVIAGTWQGRMSTSLCQQAQFPLVDYEAAARH